MPLNRSLLLIIACSFSLIISGCGGGGGGGSSSVNSTLSYIIKWNGTLPGGGNPQSIRLTLLKNGAPVTVFLLNRTPAVPSQTQNFIVNASDTFTLLTEAFDAQNASGTLIGRTFQPVTLLPNQTTSLTQDVGTAVTSVSISTSVQSVNVGSSLQLVATPLDSTGNAVVVPLNDITWSVNNGNASVNSSGLVTGAASGQSTITANELTYGKQGLITINVGTAAAPVSWTIMIYMNAANNLDDFSLLNMNQLETGLTGSNVKVIVQWKRIPQYAVQQKWTGVRRYSITHDNDTNTITSPIVQTMPDNLDMGDAGTLTDFVTWAKAYAPANHYALVVWNHGNGILRSKNNEVTRNVSYDDGTANSIYVWQLNAALGALGLDMIVFDASLMQMSEVTYQLRSVTPIVVGSEESPPGEGYPYDLIIAQLVSNPNENAATFGQTWVDKTILAYNGSFDIITQSVVDTSKLANLVSKLDTLGSVLLMKKSQFISQYQSAAASSPPYKNTLYKDLYDLCGRFISATGDPQITTAAQAVQNAITQAVLHEGHSSGKSYSHGLSIYYPNPNGYSSQYALHDIANAAPNWKLWLQNIP